MKKKLIKLLGIVLCLPLPISIVLSVAGMIANKATYERWLFEGHIFPMLAWADGSYIKSIVVWVGAAVAFIGYVSLLMYCYFYGTVKQREKYITQRANRWINA